MKKTVLCDVCLSNDAIVKSYWTMLEGTDNEQSMKLPSCGVCAHLNSKSVEKLLGLPKDRRLRLLKKWWTPNRRTTTLVRMYPNVDWKNVRVSMPKGGERA